MKGCFPTEQSVLLLHRKVVPPSVSGRILGLIAVMDMAPGSSFRSFLASLDGDGQWLIRLREHLIDLAHKPALPLPSLETPQASPLLSSDPFAGPISFAPSDASPPAALRPEPDLLLAELGVAASRGLRQSQQGVSLPRRRSAAG